MSVRQNCLRAVAAVIFLLASAGLASAQGKGDSTGLFSSPSSNVGVVREGGPCHVLCGCDRYLRDVLTTYAECGPEGVVTFTNTSRQAVYVVLTYEEDGRRRDCKSLRWAVIDVPAGQTVTSKNTPSCSSKDWQMFVYDNRGSRDGAGVAAWARGFANFVKNEAVATQGGVVEAVHELVSMGYPEAEAKVSAEVKTIVERYPGLIGYMELAPSSEFGYSGHFVYDGVYPVCAARDGLNGTCGQFWSCPELASLGIGQHCALGGPEPLKVKMFNALACPLQPPPSYPAGGGVLCTKSRIAGAMSDYSTVFFDLPACGGGNVISIPGGAYNNYAFARCNRVAWDDLEYTCDLGNWRITSGSVWADGLCHGSPPDSPLVSVANEGSVDAADRAAGVFWAADRAHDWGCSSNRRVWHARCEKADGSWSHACGDFGDETFKGRSVVSRERLPDRAWMEIVVEGC